MPTWSRFAERLSRRLVVLADADTFIFADADVPRRFAQLQQTPIVLMLEVSSNVVLPAGATLTPEEEERLRDLGWFPPDLPNWSNWYLHLNWPLSTDAAGNAARLVVASLRDVLGVAEPDDLGITGFNAATAEKLVFWDQD
jgi:hypothetical protein